MIGNSIAENITLLQLDREINNLVRDSYRPGTRRNIKTHLRSYYEFCDKLHLQYFPASTTQLTRFAVYLFSCKNLVPETITNYISTIRTIHGLQELPIPDSSDIIITAALKGMKARLKRMPKQAQAIDPLTFKLLAPHVNYHQDLELVAWVACLMGFHLLLRASNIVSPSRNSFDPEQNLTRQDFRLHNEMLVAHIRWTKTLQYRERRLLIPVIPFVDDQISAVYWFRIMITCIPAPPTAPAFAVAYKGKLYPLSYSQISRLIKRWAEAAQLDSSRLTVHCLR